MTDADDKTTSYSYFDNGDLERVTDPRTGATSYSYDPFGNPTVIIDPVGNRTERNYDDRSRLESSSDTFGHNLTQTYDVLDRLRQSKRTDSKGSSADEVITRTYYPGGQVRTETNGLGLLTELTLDGLNRVVRKVEIGGGLSEPLTAVTVYDGNGNVTE